MVNGDGCLEVEVTTQQQSWVQGEGGRVGAGGICPHAEAGACGQRPYDSSMPLPTEFGPLWCHTQSVCPNFPEVLLSTACFPSKGSWQVFYTLMTRSKKSFKSSPLRIASVSIELLSSPSEHSYINTGFLKSDWIWCSATWIFWCLLRAEPPLTPLTRDMHRQIMQWHKPHF